MTQPTPDDAKAAAEKAAAAKAPKVLTVGHYVWTDPILRTEHDEFGVVLGVDGDKLTVRPLHKHAHTVEVSGFTPLSADDVG